MARTRVRRRRVALVAVLAGVAALGLPAAAGAVRNGPVRQVPARQYVVASGDTLWGIATTVEPGRDPRQVIDQIERDNGVDPASLQPGQVLALPAAG